MTDVENNKKEGRNEVGHSIIWAAMMIASSLVMKDEGSADTMLFLLMAGWVATMTVTGGFKQSVERECAFLRKLFGFEKTAK